MFLRLTVGRSLTPPSATPLRLSFKMQAARSTAPRQRAGLWLTKREKASLAKALGEYPWEPEALSAVHAKEGDE